MMAISCDIIDDLFRLEENDVIVSCCASNWKRVPKMAPEEITNISLADKVASLSAKLDLYDGAFAEIRCENVKLESRVSSIEKHKENKASNNAWPSIISQRKADILPQGNSSLTPGSVNPSPSSRLTVQSSPVPMAASPIVGPVRRNYVAGDSHVPHQRRLNYNGSRDRQQRNHGSHGLPISLGSRRKRGGIMGEATSGGLRSTDPPKRDFFVSRCNKPDGIDEMCAFLKSNTIVPRDVVQMNNSEAKFNSYKVSVSVVDASKMMNSGMWCTGICVRRWRDLKTINQTKQV